MEAAAAAPQAPVVAKPKAAAVIKKAPAAKVVKKRPSVDLSDESDEPAVKPKPAAKKKKAS